MYLYFFYFLLGHAYHQGEGSSHSEFSMKSIMDRLEQIQKSQVEHTTILQDHTAILQSHTQLFTQHNELLQSLNSRYEQITKFHQDFSNWAGYRPDIQPPPPYQPPGSSDGQGGQQSGDDPYPSIFPDVP